MPGLIDAHTHLSFGEPTGNDELFHHRTEAYSSMLSAYNARKVLRAGVTSVLDADCLWNIGCELRDAIESGIVEGPRMRAGGQALMTMLGGTAGRMIADEGTHRLRHRRPRTGRDGQRDPPADQVRRRLDQDHGHRADPLDEGARGQGLEHRRAADRLRHRARAEHQGRRALPQLRSHPGRGPGRRRPDLPRLLPGRRGDRGRGRGGRVDVPDVHPARQPRRLRREGRHRAGAAGRVPRRDRGDGEAADQGARRGRPRSSPAPRPGSRSPRSASGTPASWRCSSSTWA